MSSKKPDWFRIDSAEFLSDRLVDAMSTLELGACFRLLCRQWIDGYIPDDLHLLARLCRLDAKAMAEAWVILSVFFPLIEPGKRANRFMLAEREKVTADLERRSDQGSQFARKRWDNARQQPNGLPSESPNGPPNKVKNGLPIKNAEFDGLPNPVLNEWPNSAPKGAPIADPMQYKNREEQIKIKTKNKSIDCDFHTRTASAVEGLNEIQGIEAGNENGELSHFETGTASLADQYHARSRIQLAKHLAEVLAMPQDAVTTALISEAIRCTAIANTYSETEAHNTLCLAAVAALEADRELNLRDWFKAQKPDISHKI